MPTRLEKQPNRVTDGSGSHTLSNNCMALDICQLTEISGGVIFNYVCSNHSLVNNPFVTSRVGITEGLLFINMTKIKYQLRFLQIPKHIYQDRRLSKTAMLVYGFVHTYTAKNFFFSNKALAKQFCCGEQSIQRAVSQLRKYKYINVRLEVKDNGGKMRYIRDNFPIVKSDWSETSKVIGRDEADEQSKVIGRNEATTEGGNGNKECKYIKGEKSSNKTKTSKTPKAVGKTKMGTLLKNRLNRQANKGGGLNQGYSQPQRKTFKKYERTVADGRGVY